jgi:N-methylhydantoinase A
MESGRRDGRFFIGVDIGGTFTDCAVVTELGEAFVGKVPTTHDDLSRGFFDSIGAAAAAIGLGVETLLRAADRLAHGTTVGINALVTREGARVGFLTTKGHGDAIRIMDNSGRVTGVSVEEILHYAESRQPRQLLHRNDIAEITERVDCDGRVVVELDEDDVRRSVAAFLEREVEAIAISYLWSFRNPEHERRTAEIVRSLAPDLFVTASHEVAPRLGEYPRAAATVMNAYIGPLMTRYVDRIVAGARERGFGGRVLFAHCEGGLVVDEAAKQEPILTLQSGPVGGVMASAVVGAAEGMESIIATDMGGTTLDVSVIHGGRPTTADLAKIEQHEVHLRKVDVESIGAGGGSVAWIDEGTGTLRVGPRSAGAVPGPACYGLGGREATVTDADVVLGILNPQGVLGGGLALDAGAAWDAVERLGKRLGIPTRECAAGIVEIVDSRMEDLVRRVTLQRGHDPRDFTLWAYGGQGGAHATLFAQGLGVRSVVVPMNDLASVWSAYGVATAELVRTRDIPVYVLSPFDEDARLEIVAAFESLEEMITNDFAEMGVAPGEVVFERSADLKYALQVFEVETPCPDLGSPAGLDDLVAAFERRYEQQYGPNSGYRAAGFAVTALRLRGNVAWARPMFPTKVEATGAPEPSAMREVYWYELREAIETSIYDGHLVGPGHEIEGPAVLEYRDTTVVVRPGQTLRVDSRGSLVITLASPTSVDERSPVAEGSGLGA